ncbi:acetylxylan esterase [Exiguobacterium sp.]|uniref:acetylxylan esterase n=1 Tax=Exiguobacterium sp. TaxID=44751 RepID=UPI00307F8639
MPGIDVSVRELEAYRSRITMPDDFDVFWERELETLREVPMQIERNPIPAYVRNVEMEQVRYMSHGAIVHKATFIKPKTIDRSLPVVVLYHGYNWNTHEPHIAMKYVVQGMAVLLVETRDQGMDPEQSVLMPLGGAAGWMTRGIFKKETYYYTRVMLDAVRALDVALMLSGAKSAIVEGGSQGGGIALGVSALHPKVKAALVDIPFLCDMPRGVELATDGPYLEISHYFKVHDPLHESEARLYDTLRYVDGINFARRITCPVMVGVGLLDEVCPPSTGYALFRELSGEKAFRVYPEYAHGLSSRHEEEKLKFLAPLL